MAPKQSADLALEARWVLPIAPANTVLSDHAVIVTAGRIVAVGPIEEMRTRFEPRERVVRDEHVLLPGFVNAHTRASMTLLRGVPVPWQTNSRQRLLWPGESQDPAAEPWSTVLPSATATETVSAAQQHWMSPDFVRDGTQIAIAEMLRAGITAFADSGLFPDEAARAASAARMRAVIGLPVSDGPTPWAESATAHLDKAERLWDEYRSDPWVSLYFAPFRANGGFRHEMPDDTTLARVRRVADELDARIALGLRAAEGVRHTLLRLQGLGLLRPGFTALHLDGLDESHLEIITRTGISAVVCPQASLRLGRALTPVGRLEAHGITVGLGTDDPTVVGALDLLAECRAAALTVLADSPTGFESAAADFLRMATLGGAAALGLNALTGSLEPGKAADVICLDLSDLACQPATRPHDVVVFAATRHQISDVWTAGRAAVSGGRLLAFDEQELRALARQWAVRIGS